MFLSIDCGPSQIYSSDTTQGGPPSMFLSVDGGSSRISSSGTTQGVCHRRFLALILNAPGSLLSPARGPTVDIS
jgi:hypothetical protein